MPKKVLVTGANGYTGSHLCKKLVERGHKVLGLVKPSSNLSSLDGLDVQLLGYDLADGEISPEDLRGVEVVYHIAAIYRREGVPRSYFERVNVGGTRRMLDASLKADVPRFVHCSTVGVQGNIDHLPASETNPYNPGDDYQRSKMEGEILALSYHQDYNYPVTVVRPTGIYGPGDMRFLKLFRGISRGRFVMIGNGDVYYHLTYIDDLVDGILLAGEEPRAVGEIFTLAGNEYLKINKLVEIISRQLDKPLWKISIPVWPVMLVSVICQKLCQPLGIEPPLYPRRLDFFTKDRAFDISKARDLLGYNPKVDLETGLARTIDWYRRNHFL